MNRQPPANAPVPVGEVARAFEASPGLNFERVQVLPGSTFKDARTVLVIPTRGDIPYQVVQRLHGLIAPMNQARWMTFATGHEVGRAYDAVISNVLAHPELSKWPYVLTLEDDNLPPPDAHIRLLESIEAGPGFDAVSAIYYTKGDIGMPMAYGDPATGLDFRPIDVREHQKRGHLVEVNGIAMGCALWRLDLFRQIPPPWFVTVNDYFPDKGGSMLMTQDLYFCREARMRGKRFAVDFRVKVGHMDRATGIVY